MLSYAISEVEKLQAMQQLTDILLPSSTVNMMPPEEYWCFQCQEPGHIAHQCPIIHCFKHDEYGHIVMVCPPRIPLSGTPAHHPRPWPCSRYLTQSSSWHCHEDRCRCSWSRSLTPTLTNIAVELNMNPTGAAPGHTTGITDGITEAVHNDHTLPTHIIPAAIPHIADHQLIEALPLIQETTAVHAHDQPTNLPRKIHMTPLYNPVSHKVEHIPKGLPESQ